MRNLYVIRKPLGTKARLSQINETRSKRMKARFMVTNSVAFTLFKADGKHSLTLALTSYGPRIEVPDASHHLEKSQAAADGHVGCHNLTSHRRRQLPQGVTDAATQVLGQIRLASRCRLAVLNVLRRCRGLRINRDAQEHQTQNRSHVARHGRMLFPDRRRENRLAVPNFTGGHLITGLIRRLVPLNSSSTNKELCTGRNSVPSYVTPLQAKDTNARSNQDRIQATDLRVPFQLVDEYTRRNVVGFYIFRDARH